MTVTAPTDPLGSCPCGHLWLRHDVEEYRGDGTETCCVEGCTQTGCPGRRPRWTLSCYGQLELDAEYDTFNRALTAAAHHIRSTCPHGPMPWATTITWHQTTLPELGGRYVSCGGGSWLNHHLIPTTPPGQDHAGEPPSLGAEHVAGTAEPL